MVVPPGPVCLLIVVVLLGEILLLAMVLFCIHVIGLIFIAIPLMIVTILFVVVSAGLPILSMQGYRRADWDYQSSAQQGWTHETEQNCTHTH